MAAMGAQEEARTAYSDVKVRMCCQDGNQIMRRANAQSARPTSASGIGGITVGSAEEWSALHARLIGSQYLGSMSCSHQAAAVMVSLQVQQLFWVEAKWSECATHACLIHGHQIQQPRDRLLRNRQMYLTDL